MSLSENLCSDEGLFHLLDVENYLRVRGWKRPDKHLFISLNILPMKAIGEKSTNVMKITN